MLEDRVGLLLEQTHALHGLLVGAVPAGKVLEVEEGEQQRARALHHHQQRAHERDDHLGDGAKGIGGESSMKRKRTKACTSIVERKAGSLSVATALGKRDQRLTQKRARTCARLAW